MANKYTNPRVILKRKDRINYVISGIVMYYGVPMEKIMSYSRRPATVNRKRMATKILRDIADISWKEIASIANSSGNNAYTNYLLITEDMQTDKSLHNTYREIHDKLMGYE